MQWKDFQSLRECPFCGGGAETKMYLWGHHAETHAPIWCYYVYCVSCDAMTDNIFKSKEDAVAAWNRRTEQESELPASSTPTNAQRIRSVSDEELQKFLRKFESGDIDYAKTFCDLCCKDAALERRSVDCDGCLLWWLKNDAKQQQEGEGERCRVEF